MSDNISFVGERNSVHPKDDRFSGPSYFPIVVIWSATDESEVIQSPDELIAGKPFRVVATKVKLPVAPPR